MEQDKKIDHKTAETYAQDMAKVISGGGVGMIKKIIHGEEEHEKEKKEMFPEFEKNKKFLLFSLVLTLFAFAIILSFLLLRKNINTVEVEKTFTPIIFNDKTTFIEVKDLKKDEIEQSVFNEISKTNVKLGGVEGIYLSFDKKILNLKRFLTLIKSNLRVDPSSGKGFSNENFLLGVFNSGSEPVAPLGKSFFLLLKMSSLPDVFNDLRAWENKMFFDLHGFLGIEISPETKYLLTKNFEDGIIENKNARILYDNFGKIVIMYVLADDDSIIITNTTSATHEIILRLASSRVKK